MTHDYLKTICWKSMIKQNVAIFTSNTMPFRLLHNSQFTAKTETSCEKCHK